MSTVGTIRVELIANAQKFKQGIDKAKKSTKDLEKATGQVSVKQKQFQTRLRDVAGSIAAVQGPLGPVAGRLNAIGAITGRVSGKLLGFLAVGTLVAVTLGKFVKAGARAESQFLKLNAILKATGNAAGQTATDIEVLAESIGKNTLASVQGARDAAGVLLTFKSISGETFGEVLRLSQDLAAVGFGSIQTAAIQLGKALEEPEIGLSSLRRVGVSFTEQQKEQIKVLSLTGQQAKAQALILKALDEQVGGAGAGAAGGLAGAFDTLAENINLFFERNILGVLIVKGLTAALNGLANVVGFLVPALTQVETTQGGLTQGFKESNKVITDNLKTINQLLRDKEKLSKLNIIEILSINRQISKLEDQIEVEAALNAERKKKLDFLNNEKEVVNKANDIADKTIEKLTRQKKREVELAEAGFRQKEFLKIRNKLEDALVSKLGESEVAQKAIKKIIDEQSTSLQVLSEKTRIRLQLEKERRSLENADDKRLRNQRQEIENFGKSSKELAVLNAIRAEENRLRSVLSNIQDPIERERQVNNLIEKRIPILTKQTEEFFELQEKLGDISTIAEGIGESFDKAGNKIVDAFLRGETASLNFKDILRELLIEIQKTIIQVLFLNKIKEGITTGIENIFGGTPKKAGGGAVQRNTPTLVGERGPELFVPKTAGVITPSSLTPGKMGGSSVVINQNLNFALGVTNTVRSEIANLLPTIQQSTLSAVSDAKLRGGKFAKAFGG